MPKGKHNGYKRGSDHPRWNRTRIIGSNGYVKIRVGKEHPLADPNGYAYEHLLVWVSAGRPMLTKDELLHHRNEDKEDNRLGNLELRLRGDHNALHLLNRGRGPDGRFLPKEMQREKLAS